jgi:hypothetical protein
MIDAIVLSKDRAAQLELLLQSIEVNMPYVKNVRVLYKSSDHKFSDGYELLLRDPPNLSYTIIWTPEQEFKNDMYRTIAECSRYFTFFTDDDIVYRNHMITEDEMDEVFDDFGLACISLRLGLNTTVQYNYTGERALFPAQMVDSGQLLVWNHNSVPGGNFGYPMSVDGHIFERRFFLSMLDRINFDGPNSMEGRLHTKKSFAPPNMACLRRSVVVNTPLNRVQDVCTNRSGEQFGISDVELNDRFLAGERARLHKIDFSAIVGCHQELDICMESM